MVRGHSSPSPLMFQIPNTFRICKAVPFAISCELCLGTKVLFFVIGLYHMSCLAPCFTRVHPAAFISLTNSFCFICNSFSI